MVNDINQEAVGGEGERDTAASAAGSMSALVVEEERRAGSGSVNEPSQ